MDEVTSVENFFKSYQVHLSRAWLESCINWCKEENLAPNYTLKDLQYNVFEQWLLLDLREVEIPCLPSDLSNKLKYTLDNTYTLQLMQIVDISKPKYSQLQKIRNGISKNLEQEFQSSKRMLQLTLTDGVQEVEAMEYTPIRCLNLNLPPGIKIRIMGPIQVRRGRLMLEEKHVKVLGGEVDSLLVSHAAENVLAQCLNQPLNLNPEGIEEHMLAVENDFNENAASTVMIRNNPMQNNQSIQRNIPVVHNQINIANIPQNNLIQSKNNINSSNQNDFSNSEYPEFDDDLKIEEEIEMLMEVERELEQSNKIEKKVQNKTPDMFGDMDVDFECIDIPTTFAKPKPPNIKKQQEITTFFNKPEEINNSKKSNFKEEIITIADSPEKNPLSPKPIIWTVKKLVNTIPNVTNGKFKIKAKFKSIVEKLVVINNEFHLVIEVCDDSDKVALKVHNDIVAELMGYTAISFMGLKEELEKNNVDGHRKAIEALKSLQTRLITLDNVLEVLVNVKEKFPIIVKILSKI